ncbi:MULTISPECIES: nucleotide kinase domain-containing protein [unclassified Pseudomonas]|uniref:nucleotide kinase domain-containing protein n=1 Tax=Pseudomonas sp. S3(2024) TaxID=3111912 RepID=UPI002FDF5CB1
MSNLNFKPNYAYDDYWVFAHARQEAFLSRLSPTKPQDSIISKYKFTNCYRVLDRTSQYLIKNVIYDTDHSAEDTFFRIILFKLFNRIETWEQLEKQLGTISVEDFSIKNYCDAIAKIKLQDVKIYSAAYIMPSGKAEYGHASKHMNNLEMIQLMLNQEMHKSIWDRKNLSNIYQSLLTLPSVGKFLAYQYAIDLAYSNHCNADESQFVVAGPGAERGIKKIFPNAKKTEYEHIIKHMTEIQEQEFSRLNLPFSYLPNRNLQLIDCQNLFCELDKFLRVKRPELGKPGSRIKQKYSQNKTPIDYVFPPKWNVPEFREKF